MAWNEIRHRARLVREFGPVPAVIANEARLGQVFLNLLMNAAQAIPEGHVAEHRVRVVTREQGDRVVVEIIDTGAGIAPDVRERIFDPFFTTKPVGEGIGLGLSICHGIVANLGGEIQVESAPGRGSTFRVLLPASNRVRVDDPSRPPRTLLPPRRARVLLVDDEANLRTSLGQILGAEHEVREAASGAEVLELLRGGERYDVLLCDLMMPEMSGIDLFDAIERLDDAQARRVIFLTGGAFTPRAQEFMARVPNPRLEKPFDIDASAPRCVARPPRRRAPRRRPLRRP
jgi:CheY-like chemotaxis protein